MKITLQKIGYLFFPLALFARPRTAHADLFGADIPLLVQILGQSIEQYGELVEILGTANKNLDLLNDINKGIHDSLDLFNTMQSDTDPGLYGKWTKLGDSLRGVKTLYGDVPKSKDELVQKDVDQDVAEAITLNNSIYAYAAQIDQIGESIKRNSNDSSPGKAQKLTAQSQGVMIHVMDQGLRAQATGLKLQAQQMAVANRRDKEQIKQTQVLSDDLENSLKSAHPKIEMPRF